MFGCDSNSETKTKPLFGEAQSLIADSLMLDLPFAISNWKIEGDKVMVFDQTKKDGLLTVLQLPDFKPLYTYGKIGRAGGEFIAPMWLDTKNVNSCGLYDMMNKRMFIYDIQSDTITIAEEYAMGREDVLLEPYTVIQQYNDSVYLYRNDNPKSTVVELRNPASQTLIKRFLSLITRPTGVSYTPYDYIIHQVNNSVIFAFRYIDRMEFYEKSGADMVLKFVFGSNQGQEKDVPDYNLLKEYYADITNNGRFICALFQQEGKSTVEVWSAEGTPVKKYELDKYVSQIRMDKNSNILYAYSPIAEHSVIYKYTFDL